MEEDAEILDWGNEDDEVHAAEYNRDPQQRQETRSRDVRHVGEDEDDAVSLGDDEDEDIYPYKSASQDNSVAGQPGTSRAPSSSQQTVNGRQHDFQRESSGTPQKPASRHNDSSELRRTQSLGKMTHALPPKPAVAPPPFITPTPTPLPLARAMVTSRGQRKSNGHGKSATSSHPMSSLPPDWEERWPSSGGQEPYYYNVRTHVSTWARPEGTSPGMASPNKETEAGSRSMMASPPLRNSSDNGARPSGRRDGKRRVSPGDSLSYEDRHYRPGGDSPSSGSNQVVDRRDTYAALPPRPPSPHPVDSRRTVRSLTPPFRRDPLSQEETIRSRRDRSPPPPNRGGRRDRSNSQVELPHMQDRSWVPRNVSPPPNAAGRSLDNRAMAGRGRHDRISAQPPLHATTAIQGSRNDTSEWSASRPRSPPPIREASPPRRYADRASSPPLRQKNRRDRSSSPVLTRTSGYADTYISKDSVPQRRVRESDFDSDSDAKRRRIDRSPSPRMRDAPDDRSQRAERPLPNLPPDASDMSRLRKRQPLPPQSDRFRQASRSKPMPESTLPLQTSSQQSDSQRTRLETDRDEHARSSVSSFADVPSGPRSQAQPPTTRDSGERNLRDPPTRPGGRTRSRFDSSVSTPQAQLERASDVMEVDLPATSRGSARFDESLGRSALGGYSERIADGPSGTLPKGPRAMLNGPSSQTPPMMSPIIPSVNFRSLPQDSWQRGPPPHMKQDALPTMPRNHAIGGPLASQAPRGFDESPFDQRQSRMPPPTEPRGSERDSSARLGRRGDEPPSKFSGSNNTPVGEKRLLPPSRFSDGPTGPLSERYAGSEGRGRYDDNRASPRSSSYHSPVDSYRPLPPANEPSRPWQSRDDTRKGGPNRYSPPPSNQLPVRRTPAEREESNPPKDRSGRGSRFGPEREATLPPPPLPVVDNAPREWITREDAQRGLISRSTNSSLPPALAADERPQYRRGGPDSDNSAPRTNGSIDERDDAPAKGWARRLSATSNAVDESKRPSLEVRLSSMPSELPMSESPYRDRVDRPRGSHRADGDRERGWNRTPEPPDSLAINGGSEDNGGSASSGLKMHPDRLRLFDRQAPMGEPPLLLPHPQPTNASSRGGNVKIKRRARSPERDQGEGIDDRFREEGRPGAPRRGGSLLDRLTGVPEVPARNTDPATSLRDRVDVPTPALPSIPGLPPRPVDVAFEEDGGSPSKGGGRGNGRRRSGKPRKAKR